jgi:TonB family protein
MIRLRDIRARAVVPIWLLSICLPPAGARAAAAEDAPSFDIPAQPLAAALEAFSVASGVQLLYDSALAGARRSPPLRGRMPADTALAALLDGSGLVIRHVGRNEVVLQSPADARAAEAAGTLGMPLLTLDPLAIADTPDLPASGVDQPGYRAYGLFLQARVHDILQAGTAARGGNWQARVDVWVGPSGRITRAAMRRSTGDAARDAAIAQALQAADVGQPPPRTMPQPVTLAIGARGS